MRLIFILLMSFGTICCKGSEDDTLPRNKSKKFLAFPFALRSPETNWGFGAAGVYFFRPKNAAPTIRTSDFNLVSLYTLRRQVVIVFGSTIFFPEERQVFRLQSSYSYYPDKFWGIGNNTLPSDVEDYSLKQFFFNPQLMFHVYDRLMIGATVELQNVADFSYVPDGKFEEQNIAGRSGGFTSGAGILLTWDTRNNSYSPDKGIFAEFNMTRFEHFLGSDFRFASYTFDLRKFLPAGKNRVLALQFFTRFNQGETPIRYLSLLGGSEVMRGYYKGRFADQGLLALQAELRQFLFWRIGITAFGGAGQVAGKIRDLGFDRFHYAYGGGLRLMVQPKEKLNLRIDFGYGENSNGVYVILKEAF